MNTWITFCAVYRNESSKIEKVLDWAADTFEHIILAVQDSEDNTLDICKRYTNNIIQRPSESPEESRDIVMESVETPWVLWLDADEYPSVNTRYMFNMVTPEELINYDSVSFLRMNYIDGFIIEGGQGEDRQIKMVKKDVRWNPKAQGRRIHIHPMVKKTMVKDYMIDHHRTFEKIKRQTLRWNELESSTINECNKYVVEVEKELCLKRAK